MNVATFERRSLSQRTASLGSQTKKDPKWLPLVSEIEELTPDGLLVLVPEADESIRALKVQVSRAAGKAGKKDDIQYGEGENGQLEVWLRAKAKQTRGPRKKRSDSGEG
jgi:hypothetical protein